MSKHKNNSFGRYDEKEIHARMQFELRDIFGLEKQSFRIELQEKLNGWFRY